MEHESSIYCIDIETDGALNGGVHRIVEIALVDFDRDREFHAYVNPEGPVSFHATKTHGLTQEDLSACPTLAVIADSLKEWLDTSVLIAHYGFSADFRWLKQELARINREDVLDRVFTLIDTSKFRRGKLTALAEEFSVESRTSERHSALEDARILKSICTKMIESRSELLDFIDPEYEFFAPFASKAGLRDDEIEFLQGYSINNYTMQAGGIPKRLIIQRWGQPLLDTTPEMVKARRLFAKHGIEIEIVD